MSSIAVEAESAHRKYQQLLAFKKPLQAILNSLGESDSDQKDSVKQLLVSLQGSTSFKIGRRIAILGMLYGEKCKSSFAALTRSVRTLVGLRQSLRTYINSNNATHFESEFQSTAACTKTCHCFGCISSFLLKSMALLEEIVKHPALRLQLQDQNALEELFKNNLHQGSRPLRVQTRKVICA